MGGARRRATPAQLHPRQSGRAKASTFGDAAPPPVRVLKRRTGPRAGLVPTPRWPAFLASIRPPSRRRASRASAPGRPASRHHRRPAVVGGPAAVADQRRPGRPLDRPRKAGRPGVSSTAVLARPPSGAYPRRGGSPGPWGSLTRAGPAAKASHALPDPMAVARGEGRGGPRLGRNGAARPATGRDGNGSRLERLLIGAVEREFARRATPEPSGRGTRATGAPFIDRPRTGHAPGSRGVPQGECPPRNRPRVLLRPLPVRERRQLPRPKVTHSKTRRAPF
jgi:hypothetical protein